MSTKPKLFSVKEMWEIQQGSNMQWGIEGYEAPRKYADAKKMKWDKEVAALKAGHYVQNTRKITKKGHYLDFQMKS